MNTTFLKRTLQTSLRLNGKLFGLRIGSKSSEPQTRMHIWSIGMYTGDSPLTLKPAPNASNPVLTCDSISDVRALFVADPFMVKGNDAWHMFFEVLNLESFRGEIGLASSEDMVNWTYRQIVLREPFHLSYPYVFVSDGEYYMIPESHKAKSVRLYKAVDFPLKWVFVGDVLSGDDFVDSSVFRFNNLWWMLNDLAKPPYDAGTLRLFHSERLTGPWVEHPRSPVIDGNAHAARPAGRVLMWNDRVIRFAQDCCPVYGIQIRAFELTELTTTTFQERELSALPILQGGGEKWNESGMHHIDAHLLDDDSWIACVDGWHWNS